MKTRTLYIIFSVSLLAAIFFMKDKERTQVRIRVSSDSCGISVQTPEVSREGTLNVNLDSCVTRKFKYYEDVSWYGMESIQDSLLFELTIRGPEPYENPGEMSLSVTGYDGELLYYEKVPTDLRPFSDSSMAKTILIGELSKRGVIK